MRTKTLLCTAAVMAAGLGASMAQSAVYSVNAVGYVNVSITNGFTLISNPLNATNNTIGSLLSSPLDFTVLYKWNVGSQQFDIASYAFGGWDHPEFVVNPGDGAFISSPGNTTYTFVGDVLQGNLSNPVAALYTIKSSQVPQTGLVSALGLTVNDFDILYKWDVGSQAYVIYSYAFGGWSPSEPTISVGEAVFLSTGTAYNWTRNFSVN